MQDFKLLVSGFLLLVVAASHYEDWRLDRQEQQEARVHHIRIAGVK